MKNVIILSACILLSLTGYSQDSESVYKLTANDVEHFIAKYPELEKDLEDFGAEYDHTSGEFVLPETVHAMSDFNHIITKYSYTDYNDFVAKAASIIMAYASIVSKEGLAESENEIKAQIKEIDDNPNLSHDQKEMMKTQLQASLTLMQSYGAIYSNSANISVVKQYLPQLKAVFEE